MSLAQDFGAGASPFVSLSGVGGSERTDVYIRDTSIELGVKLRGGKSGVELKTLIARYPVTRGLRSIDVELWVKTTWDALPMSGLPSVTVDKKRRLRKFARDGGSMREVRLKHDTEETADGAPVLVGCNVELTSLVVEGEQWSTIGAESFGSESASFDTLREVLVQTLDALGVGDQGWLSEWDAQSYASWIVHQG